MAAPKGNKHAEKWTLKTAQEYLQSIHDYVEQNKDCPSMEAASTACGHYETVIYFLRDKYKGEIDFEPIKKAKAIIKSRLIEKGLKGEYNPTMTIFILKNNHDMKDKQEIDQNIKTDIKGITFE